MPPVGLVGQIGGGSFQRLNPLTSSESLKADEPQAARGGWEDISGSLSQTTLFRPDRLAA